MTLFAVMQAGLFPLLHLGRPWFFYWLLPYPATMQRLAQLQERAAVGRRGGRPPTSRSRCCSGTSASSPISRRCAIARRRAGSASSTASSRSAGAARRATGATTASPTACSPAWPRRSCSRCTRWCRRDFAIDHPARLALDDLPAVLRRRRHLLRLLHGADADDPHPPRLSPAERHHRSATSTTSAKMILVTGLIVDYSYICEFYLAWYSGERLRDVDHAARARPTGRTAGPSGTRCSRNVPARAGALVQGGAHQRAVRLGGHARSSTSACGPSASASSRCRSQRDFLPSSWAALPSRRRSTGDPGLGTGCFFTFLFLLFLRFVPFVPLAELKELKSELRPRWD